MVLLEILENCLRVGKAKMENEGSLGMNLAALLLEECGGVAKVESLYQNPNLHIYSKVIAILDNYFAGDEFSGNDSLDFENNEDAFEF